MIVFAYESEPVEGGGGLDGVRCLLKSFAITFTAGFWLGVVGSGNIT